MSAEQEPRINLKERTPLETVIPLSTPFLIFLDPSSKCNFRCKFCPTGDPKLLSTSRRKNSFLPLDIFKKVVADLDEFDEPLKVLRLYKDGEPFLNRDLPLMVKYAKQSHCIKSVDVTTNGSLLTPKRVKPVIEAGLDQINISLNGMSSQQIWDFCRAKVDFDALVNNVRQLYDYRGDCKILIKTVAETLSQDDQKRFIEIFSPIVDKIYIEHMAPCWPTFEVEEKVGMEITQGIYGQAIQQVDTCPYVFYSMAVNADGLASLCFLDWGHELILGDLRKQSLKEIWNSGELLEYQLKFLDGERQGMEFCKDCCQLSHGQADNIDPMRTEIAQRLCRIRGLAD